MGLLKTPIVVVACHFRAPGILCETTVARLRAAGQLAVRFSGGRNVAFFVTGNVPFRHGGSKKEQKTLAELMRDLYLARVYPATEVRIGEGVETFSESRTVTREIAEDPKLSKEFYVVGSPFYFLAGRRTWERRAQEAGLLVHFAAARRGAGWKTWLRYSMIAIVVRAAVWCGCEAILEKLVTSRENRRKTVGFSMDGCG